MSDRITASCPRSRLLKPELILVFWPPFIVPGSCSKVTVPLPAFNSVFTLLCPSFLYRSSPSKSLRNLQARHPRKQSLYPSPPATSLTIPSSSPSCGPRMWASQCSPTAHDLQRASILSAVVFDFWRILSQRYLGRVGTNKSIIGLRLARNGARK